MIITLPQQTSRLTFRAVDTSECQKFKQIFGERTVLFCTVNSKFVRDMKPNSLAYHSQREKLYKAGK